MIAIFSADLYRDPGTGSSYVVICAMGLGQAGKHGDAGEPTDYAGPLSPAELAQIRESGKTDMLAWHGDLPRAWPTWELREHLWSDVIGAEQ